jgi:MFS family permease
LYFIYNGVASIFAIPFGRLSDKIGRKHLLVLGYSVFTMTYLIFAFSSNSLMIVLGFVIYGLYTALISGAEKAFIAEIAPQTLKGTMLGLHATLVGISLLPASIFAGLLWKNVGSFAPFLFGAILSLAATIVLQVGMVNKRDEK